MMKMIEDRRARAIALTVAATFLWPLQEATGRLLIREHHAAQVVWLRYATHLLVLLALVLPTRGLRTFRTQRPLPQLLRGLCMFGMPATYILAIDLTSNAWIWTLFWTMPLMVLTGATMLLQERPPALSWATAALGTLSAALVLRASPGGALASLLALAMGASFGGYVVLSRILRHESLNASLLYTALGAGLPVTLIVGRVWTPLRPEETLAVLATGLLSILILGCFDLALEAVDLALVAPLIPLVLVWETAIAAPLRGTDPLPLLGIGVAALGAVVMIVSRRAPAADPLPIVEGQPTGR